jgi:hypothetical protein
MNERTNINEWEKEKATAEDQNLPVMASWCDIIPSFRGLAGESSSQIYTPGKDPMSGARPGASPFGSLIA